MKKIAIIGPECTGKTWLATKLAAHFNTNWVPEYARDYIEKLDKKYTYSDVEHIASIQLQQIKNADDSLNEYLFFDTELIITKVWFDVVFKKEPRWLNEAILNSNFSLYLLCIPDIPWEPDSVRENGGEFRQELFFMYKKLLDNFSFQYAEINGIGEVRFQNALKMINKLNKQHGS